MKFLFVKAGSNRYFNRLSDKLLRQVINLSLKNIIIFYESMLLSEVLFINNSSCY